MRRTSRFFPALAVSSTGVVLRRKPQLCRYSTTDMRKRTLVLEPGAETPLRNQPTVRIVLVRPRNPLNIAAAARAARNFGFDDLALVAPYGPVMEELREKPRAKRWLRSMQVFRTLAEAIGNCNLVIGTSSLSRRHVEEIPVLSLDNLPSFLRREKQFDRVAVLFGSEKRGLTNQDLSRCSAVVRIPTTAEDASMNLGQAVAVCCYELQREPLPTRLRQSQPKASVEEISRVVAALAELLDEPGSSQGLVGRRLLRIQRILARFRFTSGDVSTLLGVFRDLRWRLRR